MNEAQTATALHAWRLCESCAESIFGLRPPTPAYADATARLLFMTVSHESDGFQARRQYTFAKREKRLPALIATAHADNDRDAAREYEKTLALVKVAGAFGLWQVERATGRYCLQWLAKRDALLQRAYRWVQPRTAADVSLNQDDIGAATRLMCVSDGDALSCLLARIKYLTIRTPNPRGIGEMALYAKRYYNTAGGSATSDDYRRAFERWWPCTQGQNEGVER